MSAKLERADQQDTMVSRAIGQSRLLQSKDLLLEGEMQPSSRAVQPWFLRMQEPERQPAALEQRREWMISTVL